MKTYEEVIEMLAEESYCDLVNGGTGQTPAIWLVARIYGVTPSKAEKQVFSATKRLLKEAT